jgi:hypothetical protein
MYSIISGIAISAVSFIGGVVLRNKLTDTKINGIRRIKCSIEEHTKSSPIIVWLKTIRTVFSMYLDKVHDSYVKKIKSTKCINDKFEIHYYHNNNHYKIRLENSNKDMPCLNVYNENNEDITKIFNEYLGPDYNFHNNIYTPSDMNCKSITILDENLNKTIFEENDPIYLTIE